MRSSALRGWLGYHHRPPLCVPARCLSVTTPSLSPPRSLTHPIPSSSSYLSLYRQLLRSSARFDDDVIRHFLLTHLPLTFRRHRQQHLSRHAQDSQHYQQQLAARRYVKDRIRSIIDSTPLPAPFTDPSPRIDGVAPAPPTPLLPSTTHIAFPLRLLLRHRFRSANRFLHLLQRALAGHRSSRVRLLALSYGLQGPLLPRMRAERSRRLLDPHWTARPDSFGAVPLHPLQEAAVRWGTGGEGEQGQRGDWLDAYRLMILDRCTGLDREWRRCYRQLLRLSKVPNRVQVDRVESEADGVSKESLSKEEEQMLQEWVEPARSAQRNLRLHRTRDRFTSHVAHG